MRQAGGTQEQEQVHLGNAELDMLAVGRELPFGGRGDVVGLEGVELSRLGGDEPVEGGKAVGDALFFHDRGKLHGYGLNR